MVEGDFFGFSDADDNLSSVHVSRVYQSAQSRPCHPAKKPGKTGRLMMTVTAK